MTIPRHLTDRDLEVLRDLSACPEGQWVRPMDVGGRDASHHSATLTKLVALGFAESRRNLSPWSVKGHKRYRVTDAGRAFVQGTGAVK